MENPEVNGPGSVKSCSKKTGILRYLVFIFQNSYVNNYGLAELGDMQKTIKKLKLNKVQHESLHTCFKVRIASNMLSCLRTEINFNWPQSLPSGLHCPAYGPDQVSSWPKLTPGLAHRKGECKP